MPNDILEFKIEKSIAEINRSKTNNACSESVCGEALIKCETRNDIGNFK